MKIEFLGDSITEGAGASSPNNMYTTLLCQYCGAEELNFGVGGTRIARQRVHNLLSGPDEDFLLRARWMDYSADFLFVFGGTNDYGHGDAPLGKRGDQTPYTFYGAVYCLMDYLMNVRGYPKEKICFILPSYRFNENNPHGDGSKFWSTNVCLEDYRVAIEEVAHQFEVPTYRLKCLPSPTPEGASEYYTDGLHPNDKGHEAIAKELYKYLKDRR